MENMLILLAINFIELDESSVRQVDDIMGHI